ncbi:baseplate J/gp47 family protein [Paraburkholderia phymatum]|uniref:Baseplate J/gp47 family protein n=1 Tax=Paraburkholderia phymatum TaxID=148447 RepID=A0ACC6U845_9BURK
MSTTKPGCECDCCTGVSAQTPATVTNRPGLSSLAYRVGTWAKFRNSMLDALSSTGRLTALKTRSDDDFTIALLDSFAVVCDILTFYSERSANEHYLGTATDPVSVRELAKLVGYRLAPGVAASVPLALTVQAPAAVAAGTALSGPQPVLVPPVVPVVAGLQAQSVPGPGEQPVTFETIAPIEARASWNALRVRTARALAADPANASAGHLSLAGLAGSVQAGDWLLVVVSNAGGVLATGVNRVAQVNTDNATQTTVVTFDNRGGAPVLAGDPTTAAPALGGTLGDAALARSVKGVVWSDQAELVAQARKLQWPLQQLEDNLNALNASPPTPIVQAFRLGVRAALFGHNAPLFATLPKFLTISGVYSDSVLANWDSPRATIGSDPSRSPGWISLDQTYPALVAGGWVVLQGESGNPLVMAIGASRQVSRTGFMLSSKITQLEPLNAPASLGAFVIRTTTVLGSTDRFTVAAEPVSDPVSGSTLRLASAQLGLRVGQQIAITGAALDQSRRLVSEVRTIMSVALVDGYTTLGLDLDLAHQYDAASVTINANVAPATEGASKSEILGSGNGVATWQRFTLKQTPLTYVSAPTPSGVASTLSVRVNGARWSEVPWLATQGPTAAVFATAVDANGNTMVQFGDGADSGARLPSGQNNVTATYRQGLGVAGNVAAGRITTLLTRPAGLQGVINPVEASGGGDPESLESGRLNAPMNVRALDRIVSLEDVGDFARASAAIAKAQAVWAWDGRRQVACVTVAGTGGAPLDASSAQFAHLLGAMNAATDGTVPIVLCSYVPRVFTVGATLTVDPALDADAVVAAAKSALRAAFGFDARSFMQPVQASEVIDVLQNVPGVIALTLDALRVAGGAATGASTPMLLTVSTCASAGSLRAMPPQLVAGKLAGAELLMLDSGPLPAVVHT